MSQSNPFAEMMESLNQTMKQMSGMQMPGMNLEALQDASRANIEAISEANRIAMEGMQALAQRAQEMATEATTDFQESAKAMSDMDSSNPMGKPAEIARTNFEKAVGNLRELAEIASKSQTEAWGIIGRRFQEGMTPKS